MRRRREKKIAQHAVSKKNSRFRPLPLSLSLRNHFLFYIDIQVKTKAVGAGEAGEATAFAAPKKVAVAKQPKMKKVHVKSGGKGSEAGEA